MRIAASVLIIILFSLFVFPRLSYADFSGGATTEINDLPFTGSYEALVLNPNLNQYFYDPTKDSLTTNGDFTIEAWIKLNQFNVGGSWLVTKDDGVSNRQFGFSATDTQKIDLQVAGIGGMISTNQSLTTNVWTYVAAVWHASTKTVDFYINGVLDSKNSTSSDIPTSGLNSQLQIGRRGDGSSGTVDGKISEVRIWGLSRTSSQIANNYNKELLGDEPGLLAYYPRWESLSNFLPVPYFSQNALPWGSQEYDHSQSLGFSNPTMNRWGCAVTSAAMVLNYHHINQLADGTPIDPGTLNTWLNQRNDGYITGYGSDGAYSYLNWSAISILTRDLFNAGKAPVKLEYQNLPVASDKSNFSIVNAKLDEDLQTNKQPDILWVSNASTSGHFIVAKGKQASIYFINDPEWHVPTLDSFNNTYMQLGRYVPSHTDLSYLVFVTNPDVDIQVTDPNGNKTGSHWQNTLKTDSFAIQNANYIFQSPISNPNKNGKQELLGIGENIFMLPKPASGNYTITLSSKNLKPFTVNLLSYDISGDTSVEKLYGFTNKNQDVVYHVGYSPDTPSHFETPSITYQSVIADIKNADADHLILHGSAIALIQLLQNSQKFFSNGNLKQASTLLDLSNTTINVSKNVTSPVVSQMLFSDITALRKTLGL
jgi:hypothetical protein